MINCRACGARLVRREGERRWHYLRRKSCNVACGGRTRFDYVGGYPIARVRHEAPLRVLRSDAKLEQIRAALSVEPFEHTPPASLDVALLWHRVAALLDELPARERAVLALRYGGDLMLEEIGELWNLSRERVRQLEARALSRLRMALEQGRGVRVPYDVAVCEQTATVKRPETRALIPPSKAQAPLAPAEGWFWRGQWRADKRAQRRAA